MADDALNVKPVGKQPIMHDTKYNGKHYSMVITTEGPTKGQPKGMKLVLEDRGVNTEGLKADAMREILREMHDFKYEKTKLENLLLSHGYKGFFLPKFHCELNPIERVWAHGKKYTRAHCDYTFKGLEKTIDPALGSVSLENIRRGSLGK